MPARTLFRIALRSKASAELLPDEVGQCLNTNVNRRGSKAVMLGSSRFTAAPLSGLLSASFGSSPDETAMSRAVAIAASVHSKFGFDTDMLKNVSDGHQFGLFVACPREVE